MLSYILQQMIRLIMKIQCLFQYVTFKKFPTFVFFIKTFVVNMVVIGFIAFLQKKLKIFKNKQVNIYETFEVKSR